MTTDRRKPKYHFVYQNPIYIVLGLNYGLSGTMLAADHLTLQALR